LACDGDLGQRRGGVACGGHHARDNVKRS
jgi:hypothetical protein